MSYIYDGHGSVKVDKDEFFGVQDSIEYFYEVRTNGLSTRHEWRLHSLSAEDASGSINDSWSDIPGWRGAGTAVPVF